MKGGKSGVGNTNWSQASLETAPRPDHYADYAALAATVAKRYPDVTHFIVWNEFKGFWNDAKQRWDYEGYTQLYNLVYKALKKVNPKIMVGGPYLVMDSVDPRDPNASPTFEGSWGAMDQRVIDAFDYWNEHKAGADFVVVDGSSYTNDDDLLPNEFGATDKLTAVSTWVREQTRDLPLWWAEYYVEPADGNDDRKGWSETHRVAVQATGMIAMAKGAPPPASTGTRRRRRAPSARAACGPRPTAPTAGGNCPCTTWSPGSTRPSGPARRSRPCRSPPTTCRTYGSSPPTRRSWS